MFLSYIFTPTNYSFVTFIISPGTCTYKVVIAHRDPPSPLSQSSATLVGGNNSDFKKFTESKLNKQKNCISASYPLNLIT